MSSAAVEASLDHAQYELRSLLEKKQIHTLESRKIDEKVRALVKHAPKRPKKSLEQINLEMENLEKRRTTTSMSLSDEKSILRDISSLKEKKAQLQSWDSFQNEMAMHKQQRCKEQERVGLCDDRIRDLTNRIRKLELARDLNIADTELTSDEIAVPEDKLGIFMHDQGSVLVNINRKYSVITDLDRKACIIKVTSSPENVRSAVQEILNISTASAHAIGLHPDALNLLLFQKCKNLHALQEEFGTKLHINKDEGIVTVIASPEKAHLIELAILDMNQHCVELDVPMEVIPKLVGKKGVTINQMMIDTGALIQVDSISKSARICGPVDSVKKAEQSVIELIKQHAISEVIYSAEESSMFEAPEFALYKFALFLEFLTADEGKELQLLRKETFGARISVAKKEQKISVTGTSFQLQATENALSKLVQKFECHHWAYRAPDPSILSRVIGKRGSTIKRIEETCENRVHIEVRGDFICVWGDQDHLESAKLQIMKIVENGMRSTFQTSPHIASLLISKKRSLLTKIEQSTGCRLIVQQKVNESKIKPSETLKQVRLVLSGSLKSILLCKVQLEEIEQQNRIRYIALDVDQVAIVIGRKGETISQLSKRSGARFRIVQDDNSSKGSEVELIGNDEQLLAAEKLINEILSISNQHVIQLDEVSMGCLLSDNENTLSILRKTYTDAVIEVLQKRDQIRVTGSSLHSLQACVHAIFRILQSTVTAATVSLPSAVETFYDIFRQHPNVVLRLQEIEAAGGKETRFVLKNDGRTAEIIGPALGIIQLKNYVEMLSSSDTRYVESIMLPSQSFARALLVESADLSDPVARCEMNEKALQICQRWGCELRIKPRGKVGAEICVEGSQLVQVYEAKKQVELLMQYYYADYTQVLSNIPKSMISRLYEVISRLDYKDQVVLSLLEFSTVRIFTDSPVRTNNVAQLFAAEIDSWRRNNMELRIPGWLVPVLLREDRAILRTITAKVNDVRVDLMRSPAFESSGKYTKEDRILIITGPDQASIMGVAKEMYHFLKEHEAQTCLLPVSIELVAFALTLRKIFKECQLHVLPHENPKLANILIFGADIHRREALSKLQALLLGSCVEYIRLNDFEKLHTEFVSAQLSKDGYLLRTIQQELPNVLIEYDHSSNTLAIKGPSAESSRAKIAIESKLRHIMETKNTNFSKLFRDSSKSDYAINDAIEGLSAMHIPSLPIGGPEQKENNKLTKNQRRRMRRRAEKEVMASQSSNGA